VKQVNWGIIGLGNIAIHIAKALKFTTNSRLVGIASKNQTKIEKFKTEFNLDNNYCFNNYKDLINCREIDAIYIALPNSLHSELIKSCIDGKKKILVEKPVTVNLLELKNIKTEYNIKDIFFAEGFMYRHHPQILKVIELLNKNIIGNLISMKSNFGEDILHKKNFFGFKTIKKYKKENRLFNKALGGGAILDLGCYPVSLSLLIASLKPNIDLKNIELFNIKKNFGNTEVDVDSYLEINFDNKFKSYVAVSFIKNIGKESEIIGDNGKLIIKDSWHGKPSIIKIINKDEKELEVKSEHNVYYYQMKNISKNILENKKKPDYPAMNFEDSLQNMNIVDKWLNDKK